MFLFIHFSQVSKYDISVITLRFGNTIQKLLVHMAPHSWADQIDYITKIQVYKNIQMKYKTSAKNI